MAVQKYVMNPLARPLAGFLPGIILLETKGRKSGQRRRNPVGGRREGGSVWIVAEHGRRANYVRNIEADPRVRMRVRGRWRTGFAHPMPDDDPRARLRNHRTVNNVIVTLLGTDLLSIRVDLDPAASPEAPA